MDKLEEVVAGLIRERLGDAVDVVSIVRDEDSDGEPILRITVAFDGPSGSLDTSRMLSVTRHLRHLLTPDTGDGFPMFRFVSKADAVKLKNAAA